MTDASYVPEFLGGAPADADVGPNGVLRITVGPKPLTDNGGSVGDQQEPNLMFLSFSAARRLSPLRMHPANRRWRCGLIRFQTGRDCELSTMRFPASLPLPGFRAILAASAQWECSCPLVPLACLRAPNRTARRGNESL